MLQKPRQYLRFAFLCSVAVLVSCTSAPVGHRDLAVERSAAHDTPPPTPREFRAAWVATVANIDWPSKRALSTVDQKNEAIEIIEKAMALGLNALIFQVRPAADALYASTFEPWSEFLTGEQGRPPDPYYDPLQFWIDESHKRGIELHAWFNPYRARHTMSKAKNAANHIATTHPNVVKSYGGFLWMDPAEPIAAQRTLDVILDVVNRYDIDGVHIDDYFYPYPVTVPGSMPPVEVEFPDEVPWRAWLAQGGLDDKPAWRRGHVNRLVEAIYTGIKKQKPWVRFGVSPFGLGKPDKRPAGIVGFSQYDKLHADVELWLEKGWMDYLVPQLYWPIAQKEQAFEVLLDYWHRQNTMNRHVFPGLFTSRIDATEKSWMPEEIADQIALTRSRNVAQGHFHFSAVALKENRRGVADLLKAQAYTTSAVPPASTWLAQPRLDAPHIAFQQPGHAPAIHVSSRSPEAWQHAVWMRVRGQWRFSAHPLAMKGRAQVMTTEFTLNAPDHGVELIVASALDRYGQESQRTVLDVRVAGASK
jgi:uncharacterized lipoprotein YddW (UPF0748 family)